MKADESDLAPKSGGQLKTNAYKKTNRLPFFTHA